MDCIFCKIAKKEIHSWEVYEDDDVYAFLDIAFDVERHTLVVPKTHCTNMLDCPPDTFAAVMKAVQFISKRYTKLGYDGVNITINNGKAAHQEVDHLHVHIYPRRTNDGLRLAPNTKPNAVEKPEHQQITNNK